ncbi:MAG: hypothetical protein JWO83_152 [Caulobacteraceae bacterium]|nr:hypothetical protein [Caulobacteraceae bacterium]
MTKSSVAYALCNVGRKLSKEKGQYSGHATAASPEQRPPEETQQQSVAYALKHSRGRGHLSCRLLPRRIDQHSPESARLRRSGLPRTALRTHPETWRPAADPPGRNGPERDADHRTPLGRVCGRPFERSGAGSLRAGRILRGRPVRTQARPSRLTVRSAPSGPSRRSFGAAKVCLDRESRNGQTAIRGRPPAEFAAHRNRGAGTQWIAPGSIHLDRIAPSLP